MLHKLIKNLTKTQEDLKKEWNIKNGAVLIRGNVGSRRPLVTCHIDTINDHRGRPLTKKDIEIKEGIICLKNTEGLACLGGDDRCGLTFAEYLIDSGMYDVLITTDEEIGGLGVNEWVINNKEILEKNNWSCIISLDRRGTNEFAVYGYDNEELNNSFIEIGYKKEYGSYTDGVDIARRTRLAMLNICVGYQHEHTTHEYISLTGINRTLQLLLNVDFWDKLTKKVYEAEVNPYDFYFDDEDEDIWYAGLDEYTCAFCGEYFDKKELNEYDGYRLCPTCLDLYRY